MARQILNRLVPNYDDRHLRHRRAVFILLLVGLIFLAGVAASLVTLNWAVLGSDYHGISPIIMWLNLIVLGSLYLLARSAPRITAYIFIGLLTILGTIPLVIWGTYIPQGLLIYALVIVLAGVIIGSRATMALAAIIAVILISLTLLQQTNRLATDTSWFAEGPTIADAIPFVITLAVIAIVAWISNREIDRGFAQYEIATSRLSAERNLLEEKVAERTKQLEQSQLEQALELHRFAEFGRLASGVVHDIANPLTAISANLSDVISGDKNASLEEALGAMRYIERYVNALRSQLRTKSEIKNFKTQDEIAQVVGVLAYKARQSKVKVSYSGKPVTMYGDPVKFSQIIANLIANALDAYSTSPAANKRVVHITTLSNDSASVIKVEDRAGGISPKSLSTIFTPFYTSNFARHGIGIGLTMVKRYVEQDFGGTIHVEKVDKDGTAFIITIPTRKPAITGLAAT